MLSSRSKQEPLTLGKNGLPLLSARKDLAGSPSPRGGRIHDDGSVSTRGHKKDGDGDSQASLGHNKGSLSPGKESLSPGKDSLSPKGSNNGNISSRSKRQKYFRNV